MRNGVRTSSESMGFLKPHVKYACFGNVVSKVTKLQNVKYFHHEIWSNIKSDRSFECGENQRNVVLKNGREYIRKGAFYKLDESENRNQSLEINGR